MLIDFDRKKLSHVARFKNELELQDYIEKYPALLNHKFDKVFGNNVVSKYPIEFI